MLKFSLSILCIICISNFAAASIQTGTITSLNVTSESGLAGPAHVEISGVRTWDETPCVSGDSAKYWSIGTYDNSGAITGIDKGMLSILMSAKVAGLTVKVWGSNSCDGSMEKAVQIGL